MEDWTLISLLTYVRTIRVPTTIIEFSTIYVPLSTPVNQPSGSAVDPIASPVCIATTTFTHYSRIYVPYVSTVLQPTTLVELSTIYISTTYVSSILVPQVTTVLQLSTTTLSQVSTLTLQTIPLSSTAVLPQVPSSAERSTIFIYATITLSFTGTYLLYPSSMCSSDSNALDTWRILQLLISNARVRITHNYIHSSRPDFHRLSAYNSAKGYHHELFSPSSKH